MNDRLMKAIENVLREARNDDKPTNDDVEILAALVYINQLLKDHDIITLIKLFEMSGWNFHAPQGADSKTVPVFGEWFYGEEWSSDKVGYRNPNGRYNTIDHSYTYLRRVKAYNLPPTAEAILQLLLSGCDISTIAKSIDKIWREELEQKYKWSNQQ